MPFYCNPEAWANLAAAIFVGCIWLAWVVAVVANLFYTLKSRTRK